MRKPHSKEFKEAICKLKNTKTAREIGEMYGITRQAVIGIWWRAGTLPVTHGKPVVVSEQARLERLHRHYAKLGRKNFKEA